MRDVVRNLWRWAVAVGPGVQVALGCVFGAAAAGAVGVVLLVVLFVLDLFAMTLTWGGASVLDTAEAGLLLAGAPSVVFSVCVSLTAAPLARAWRVAAALVSAGVLVGLGVWWWSRLVAPLSGPNAAVLIGVFAGVVASGVALGVTWARGRGPSAPASGVAPPSGDAAVPRAGRADGVAMRPAGPVDEDDPSWKGSRAR